jgi:hypothetical protein
MRARSAAESWTSAASTFSSMRLVLRVPGMGATSSPWARSQASGRCGSVNGWSGVQDPVL